MRILKIILSALVCSAMTLALALMPVYVEPVKPIVPPKPPKPANSVTVNGLNYPKSTSMIDLSGMRFDDAEQLASELSELEKLKEINIYNTELTLSERNLLVEKLPDVDFNWTVELEGVTYDSKTTEFINFERKELAQIEGLDLTDYIGLLTRLKKVDMCGCGYTNEQMEEFMQAFPEVKFVWEVKLSQYWTVRTDAVAFSTMQGFDMPHRMTSEEAQPLKYCTDLVALDLGHNNVLDLSFLKYMPNLKILILSDTMEGIIDGEWRYIKDLSMLEYCPNLVYLEYFCNQVTDLSFLEHLPNLVDLNISWSPVSDYTYLKDLPNIERLYMMGTSIPHHHYLELVELYPNARVERYGENSIDKDWRNHPRYDAMRYMFKNNKIHPMFQ